MKKSILAIGIAAAALTMTGCSSFKLGAGCYVPHGVTGQCSATTMEPGQQPAPAAGTQPPAKKASIL